MSFFTEAYYILVILFRNFFPRGKFQAEDVPDLTGRVAIVTGASPDCDQTRAEVLTYDAGGNVGIGRETIKVGSTYTDGSERREGLN